MRGRGASSPIREPRKEKSLSRGAMGTKGYAHSYSGAYKAPSLSWEGTNPGKKKKPLRGIREKADPFNTANAGEEGEGIESKQKERKLSTKGADKQTLSRHR